MKSILLFWLAICLSFGLFAQSVHITSFQHTIRWVSAFNFPPYLSQPAFQNDILNIAAEEAGRHFGTNDVDIPSGIEYHEIPYFGKPSMKAPVPTANDKDYQVAILSFLTRANAGYRVFWEMNIVVNQGNKTVYSHKTRHEMEYFNGAGYISDMAWYSEEGFRQVFRELLSELLENSPPLAEKIVVGSPEQKDAEVRQFMGKPERLLCKTSGNMLGGGNYILSLQNNMDTIAKVTYKDGWETSWTQNIMSDLAASFFKSLTGWEVGYDSRSKEKRYGRLEYADGHVISLRMEWLQITHKSTNENVAYDYANKVTPMVADAYREKELVAFYNYMARLSVLKIHENRLVYSIQGKIVDQPFYAEYDPESGWVSITSNDTVKVVLLLQNVNPESRSVSNTKLSKNKLSVTSVSSSVGRPNFKNPEWYYFYHDPGLSKADILRNLDILLCLFFGMGNQQ